MHAPHRASTTAAAPSQPIDYQKASREVRAVFDDIKKARNVPEREQFLEYLANDPPPPRAHMGEHQARYGAGRARSAG